MWQVGLWMKCIQPGPELARINLSYIQQVRIVNNWRTKYLEFVTDQGGVG